MTEPVSASFAIFGPILRTFTWFFDTALANSKDKREERRRAYSQHFVPAYERLETIHKNYLTSFHKFYQLSREFKTPSLDLLKQFRDFGIEYAAWREGLKSFSLVTRELARQFRRKEERDAIEGFRVALVNYFNVTIPSGEYDHWPSWFTYFINDFESHIREGRSPWDHEYTSTGADNPKATFIARLRSAYETEIPTKWQALAMAKASVQATFDR
jgi:hypothetical protein